MLQYLIVCPLVFLAGFVDSIAGGGGLISLPAYIIAGVPAHFAIGTNKLSSTLFLFFSSLTAAMFLLPNFILADFCTGRHLLLRNHQGQVAVCVFCAEEHALRQNSGQLCRL